MSGAKTKYGVIDNPFNIDYSFIKEAYADVNNTMKLEEGSLIKLAPTENTNISVLSGTIPSVSSQLSVNDYQLVGYKEKQNGDTGTVFMPYIPVMMSDEETEKRRLAKYANKTFAKVKLSNGNAHYRGKECEILETKEDNGHKQYLLDIEVGNTCSKSGFHTLVAYIKTKDSPYWKKIWFDEDEVELIHYDDNGKVIKKSQV